MTTSTNNPRLEGRKPKDGLSSYQLSACSSSSSLKSLRTQDPGFSLVEVIIAMGIAAFCLVAMIGLIPSGLRQVKISSEQTAATAILASVVNDIRNIPSGTNATNSLVYGVSIPAAGLTANTFFYLNEDGSRNPAASTARYAFSNSLTSSNNAAALTSGRALLWWPAAATLGNAQGSVETAINLIRN